MSYILDALKKSDQKRRQGDVPDLQSIHVPLTVEVQVSRWPYVVIIFLLMGLVFLLGWMRPWQTVIVEPPAVENQQLEIQQEKSPVVVEQLDHDITNAEVDVASPQLIDKQPVKELEQQVVVEQQETGQQSVPHLQDLPQLVQQAIPDMSFAGHVYSSNPLQRSVIINGSAMTEGDWIIDGLKIDQITRNGVVFDYQTQLFRIDILQDWSFD